MLTSQENILKEVNDQSVATVVKINESEKLISDKLIDNMGSICEKFG